MARPAKVVAYSATPTHVNGQALGDVAITLGGSGSDSLRGQLAPSWTPPTVAMMNTETKTNDGSNYRNYDGKLGIIEHELPIMGVAGVEMTGNQGFSMTFVVRVAYTDGAPSKFVDGQHQGPLVRNTRFVFSGPLHLVTPGEVGAEADAITVFTQEILELQTWVRTAGTPAAPVFTPYRHVDVENGYNRVRAPGTTPTVLTDLLDLNEAVASAIYPTQI